MKSITIDELVSSIQRKASQLKKSEHMATENGTKFYVNNAIFARRRLNNLARQLTLLTDEYQTGDREQA